MRLKACEKAPLGGASESTDPYGKSGEVRRGKLCTARRSGLPIERTLAFCSRPGRFARGNAALM